MRLGAAVLAFLPSPALGAGADVATFEVVSAVPSTVKLYVTADNCQPSCNASNTAKLFADVPYSVSVRVAAIDMASNNEYIESVTIGGTNFGQCDPSPASDYDCSFYDCTSQ